MRRCEMDVVERRKSGSVLGHLVEAAGLVVAGAAGMYLMDPVVGRRRRAVARDRAMRLGRDAVHGVEMSAADLWHRTQGVAHELQGKVTSEGAVDDRTIIDRVRAKLGRCCSHPRAIRVDACRGNILLTGPVLGSEVDCIVSTVEGVRGVKHVQNAMEVHGEADVPALQGGRPYMNGRREGATSGDWSPGTRLLVGTAGGMAVGYALLRRGVAGTLAGLLGGAAVLRAAAGADVQRLVSSGSDAYGIEVDKVINIGAPVDVVWDFWRNYDNFPLFMRNVREVRNLGGGRSHWVVRGPAGVTAAWDAEITSEIPRRRLAWTSVAGSSVRTAGVVRFDEENGGTRVTVRLWYGPPGGALGHAVAGLFGRDPKSEMDQDLARMKTLIERGKFPHDSARHAKDVVPEQAPLM